MSKEAMKLALDKVQEFKSRWCKVPPFADRVNKATREAITLAQVPIFELELALREALAEQPAQQEPVACVQDLDEVKRKHLVYEKGMDWKDPLYTSPPAQRTWVGLSDEEVKAIFDSVPTASCQSYDHWRSLVALAIENKLREKNT